MRHFLFNVLASVACFVATVGLLSPQVHAATVTPTMTWHYQLNGPLQLPDRKLYTIDLFDTPTATITQLKAQGRVVICYFSAGSYENWRTDATSFPASAIGQPLGNWPGEWWLDIRRPEVRQIMGKRMDLALSKGCDGVDADNIDGYTNPTGFPLTSADQVAFNKGLAEEAKQRALLIGLKNSLLIIPQLVSSFDYVINESCYTYKECTLLDPFVKAGKPVFIIDYGAFNSRKCSQAKSAGYNLQFYNNALTKAGKAC